MQERLEIEIAAKLAAEEVMNRVGQQLAALKTQAEAAAGGFSALKLASTEAQRALQTVNVDDLLGGPGAVAQRQEQIASGLIASWATIGSAIRTQQGLIGRSMQAIGTGMTVLRGPLSVVGSGFRALGGIILDFANRAVNFGIRQLFSLRGALLGAAGAFTLGGLLRSIVETGARFERAAYQLLPFSKNLDEAKEKVNKLFEVARNSKFHLEEVVAASRMLETFGLSSDTALKHVVNLATALQLSLPQAAREFARVMRDQTTNSRLFSQSGFRALVQLKAGVDDLTKLSLPKFREAVWAALVDPAGPIADAANKTRDQWDRVVSDLRDTWIAFQRAIADAGVFEFFRTQLKRATDAMIEFEKSGRMKEVAEEIGTAIRGAGEAVGEFLKSFDPAVIRDAISLVKELTLAFYNLFVFLNDARVTFFTELQRIINRAMQDPAMQGRQLVELAQVAGVAQEKIDAALSKFRTEPGQVTEELNALIDEAYRQADALAPIPIPVTMELDIAQLGAPLETFTETLQAEVTKQRAAIDATIERQRAAIPKEGLAGLFTRPPSDKSRRDAAAAAEAAKAAIELQQKLLDLKATEAEREGNIQVFRDARLAQITAEFQADLKRVGDTKLAEEIKAARLIELDRQVAALRAKNAEVTAIIDQGAAARALDAAQQRLDLVQRQRAEGQAGFADELAAAQQVEAAMREQLRLAAEQAQKRAESVQQTTNDVVEQAKAKQVALDANQAYQQRLTIVEDIVREQEKLNQISLGGIAQNTLQEVGEALVLGTRKVKDALSGVALSAGKEFIAAFLRPKFAEFDPKMKANFLVTLPKIVADGAAKSAEANQAFTNAAVQGAQQQAAAGAQAAAEHANAEVQAATTATTAWSGFFGTFVQLAQGAFGLVANLAQSLFGDIVSGLGQLFGAIRGLGGGGGAAGVIGSLLGLGGSAAGLGGVVSLFTGNVGGGLAQLGISAALGKGIGGEIVKQLLGFFQSSSFGSILSNQWTGAVSSTAREFLGPGLSKALDPLISGLSNIAGVFGGITESLFRIPQLFGSTPFGAGILAQGTAAAPLANVATGATSASGALGHFTGVLNTAQASLSGFLSPLKGVFDTFTTRIPVLSEFLASRQFTQLFGVQGAVPGTLPPGAGVTTSPQGLAGTGAGTAVGNAFAGLLGVPAVIFGIQAVLNNIKKAQDAESARNKASAAVAATGGAVGAVAGASAISGALGGPTIGALGGPVGIVVGLLITVIAQAIQEIEPVREQLREEFAKQLDDVFPRRDFREGAKLTTKAEKMAFDALEPLQASFKVLGRIVTSNLGGNVVRALLNRAGGDTFADFGQRAGRKIAAGDFADIFRTNLAVFGADLDKARQMVKAATVAFSGGLLPALIKLNGFINQLHEDVGLRFAVGDRIGRGGPLSPGAVRQLNRNARRREFGSPEGQAALVEGEVALGGMFDFLGTDFAAAIRNAVDEHGRIAITKAMGEIRRQALDVLQGVEITKDIRRSVHALGDKFLSAAIELDKLLPGVDALTLAMEVAGDDLERVSKTVTKTLQRAAEFQAQLMIAALPLLTSAEAADFAARAPIAEKRKSMGPHEKRELRQRETLFETAIGTRQRITEMQQGFAHPETAQLDKLQRQTLAAKTAFDQLLDGMDKLKGKKLEEAIGNLPQAFDAVAQSVSAIAEYQAQLIAQTRQARAAIVDYLLSANLEIAQLRESANTASLFTAKLGGLAIMFNETTEAAGKLDILNQIADTLRAQAQAQIADIQRAADARIKALQTELDAIEALGQMAEGIRNQLRDVELGDVGRPNATLNEINEQLAGAMANVTLATGEDRTRAVADVQDLLRRRLDLARETFGENSVEFQSLRQQTIAQLKSLGELTGSAEERARQIQLDIKTIQEETRDKIDLVNETLADNLEEIRDRAVPLLQDQYDELKTKLGEAFPGLTETQIQAMLNNPDLAATKIANDQLTVLGEIRDKMQAIIDAGAPLGKEEKDQKDKEAKEAKKTEREARKAANVPTVVLGAGGKSVPAPVVQGRGGPLPAGASPSTRRLSREIQEIRDAALRVDEAVRANKRQHTLTRLNRLGDELRDVRKDAPSFVPYIQRATDVERGIRQGRLFLAAAGDLAADVVTTAAGLARGGIVTTEMVRRVGEQGRREAVIPLESTQGIRALAGALRQAAGERSSGTTATAVGGGTTIKIEATVNVHPASGESPARARLWGRVAADALEAQLLEKLSQPGALRQKLRSL